MARHLHNCIFETKTEGGRPKDPKRHVVGCAVYSEPDQKHLHVGPNRDFRMAILVRNAFNPPDLKTWDPVELVQPSLESRLLCNRLCRNRSPGFAIGLLGLLLIFMRLECGTTGVHGSKRQEEPLGLVRV